MIQFRRKEKLEYFLFGVGKGLTNKKHGYFMFSSLFIWTENMLLEWRELIKILAGCVGI